MHFCFSLGKAKSKFTGWGVGSFIFLSVTIIAIGGERKENGSAYLCRDLY